MMRLPGKNGKIQRKAFEEAGILDDKFDKNIHESELKKTKTLRQFYDDNTLAAKQNGIDMDRADKLWKSTMSSKVHTEDDQKNREHGSPRDEHQAELEELFTLLQPAYLTLRAMGYNHYDLTGVVL